MKPSSSSLLLPRGGGGCGEVLLVQQHAADGLLGVAQLKVGGRFDLGDEHPDDVGVRAALLIVVLFQQDVVHAVEVALLRDAVDEVRLQHIDQREKDVVFNLRIDDIDEILGVVLGVIPAAPLASLLPTRILWYAPLV